VTQYNGEREELKKNLYREFMDSKQQVMDSLIVTNIIEPIWKDSGTMPFKGFEKRTDSLHRKIITHMISKIPPIGKEMEYRVITENIRGVGDSGKYVEQMIELRDSNQTQNDMLMHGVKLFVKRMQGLPGRDSVRTSILYNADTLLFKKIVAENFKKDGFSFNLMWENVNNDSLSLKKNTIYLKGDLFERTYGLEVGNYRYYLLKKVWPQFLFAITLLFVTGSAFFIAYRSLKKQMQLNVLKNDFISNISHELKTPVSTVKVALEALQNFDMKNDVQKTDEYLHMAEQEMNRLDMLINKVLNTTVLEDSAHLLNRERTDIKLLTEEVLSSMRLRIEQYGAAVNFDVGVDSCFLMIDKLHIQGVLINLIDNSLKYAVAKPEIKISLLRSGNKTSLTVSDNGPGINEEYIGKIFDKFFRVPSNNLHNVKGYGLGLSYASMVMKKHKGSIDVKNNLGGGCTFTLTFSEKA
jgi:signal transduction histidine kinase